MLVIRSRTLLVALSALAFANSYAQSPPSAQQLLDRASVQAKAENKNILVMFHASWCGWCHRLDDFLTKTEPGKKVANHFVIVHVTVMENEAHKADENPGGMDLLKKMGGGETGIPYYGIFDASQKLLITSNPTPDNPGNVGYPAAAFEIAHFMKMLRIGAPNLSYRDRYAAQNWLFAEGKKLGS